MTGLDQFSHELGDAFQIFCCRGGAGSLALEAPTAHGLLVLRQEHDLGPSGRGVGCQGPWYQNANVPEREFTSRSIGLWARGTCVDLAVASRLLPCVRGAKLDPKIGPASVL